MSGHLWKSYFEDDVDSFRHVLQNASHTPRPGTQKSFASWQGGSHGAAMNSSPGSYGMSPMLNSKGRRALNQAPVTLTRSDINSRDGAGMTILHHVASSTAENAAAFAQALLEHSLIDLYIQDTENGWTSLHRAFYFGNITIARLILNKDTQNILGHNSSGFNPHARGLVKIKDKEGYGPLDLFALTIKDRTLQPEEAPRNDSDSDDELAYGDSGDWDDEARGRTIVPPILLSGDEVFTFGSNKNVTLGFGDEDDRQFPERITLRRPDHLLQRFYREHREARLQASSYMNQSLQESEVLHPRSLDELPVRIRNTPIVTQDVQMSKLHTAVLTTDPVSNLYMCGHGAGGRLGTGDESTRHQFTCIEGGGLSQKKVAAVALGQNHTLAISDEGEVFSWGNNAFGQLGYVLPKPALKEDDPISSLPRQIYGPLKREIVIGIAASRIHSVVHTATSLYTFGKNEGQLGIVASDARSLDSQVIPRKVAASLFSSPISSASAIDGATICLLENREVWVFANFGYARLNFPLDGFTHPFFKESWLTTKYDTTPNQIKKITAGGDTVCALSSAGEVFTVALSRRSETGTDADTSTTNPKQIRGALSTPYRIWSAKSSHMAARDVDVDHDGSIILTTQAGTVWRRTKRATLKNANVSRTTDNKPKDYKFLRVPGLTRVIGVRASAFGAYAAIRRDCNVTKTQIGVDEPNIWKDLASLVPIGELFEFHEDSEDENPTPRFWQRPSNAQSLRKRTLQSKDLETEVTDVVRRKLFSSENSYDMVLATTLSDVRIPVHEFVLAGRSRVIRDVMLDYRVSGKSVDIPEVLSVTEVDGKLTVLFQGVDFLTVFNIVVYIYTDSIVDFWNYTRQYPKMAFRYRAVRVELMKVASKLEMKQLEPAVRQMVSPIRSLDKDMVSAIKDQSYFESGDVIVELADGERLLHSDILCQRCPFFEGLFRGRAGGQWLAGRRTEESRHTRVDLSHVESDLFELVVRHIYTDAGEEMFDDFTSEDLNDYLALDELLDHIMDIMSIANELMLDRLSQICQRLIGRYVNSRNVCSLLDAIAPSSVAEFKDATLEYVCLSLEAVLQNGSLDEMDDEVLLDLDAVVRDNQLATLPFARSGRAESLLFDKYPDLAERIERGKRARIDAIVLSNKFSDNDGTTSASFRAQSLEEVAASPLRQRNRRKSRDAKLTDSPSATPALRGKTSVPDLMFEMSDGEDDELDSRKPISPPRFHKDHSAASLATSPEESWPGVSRKQSLQASLVTRETISSSPLQAPIDPRTPDRPWGVAPLGGDKLDLKDIMSQTATDKPSNLTIGLSQQSKEDRPSGSFQAKVSQKERKRQQQSQQLGHPSSLNKPQPVPPTVSPWQAMSHRKSTPTGSPVVVPTPPPRTTSTPQLTMRQTIANNGAGSSKQKTPSTPSQSARKPSTGGQQAENRPSPASGPGMAVSTTPIATPHSVRHIPLPSHSPTSPSQHLSMIEILSMQELEKHHIKDAASKRSLQEIQQEQEFQQWWDQESKRVMLEEEQQKRAAERAAKASRGRGRGRGGRGGKATKGKDKKEDNEEGRAKANKDDAGPVNPKPDSTAAKSTPRQDGNDRGRGKAKGPRGRGGPGGRGGGRGSGATVKENAAPQAAPQKQSGGISTNRS
ncbi:hypothetical protein BU24DRAFT_429806 [Aaosphaeria arxii CBS 175.79]|uniref:BTB domain-containing protein n=1 Tax=Aaosphaeria arxii CBS 175.79 TaxID=1450172 RepID=A0A6A5Y8I3_9PLEO|nr:uncharacterized protein BU24DRAFT_429806 [Aaosphaeria arxii CBS 175.79]KAF2020874.1 hypothetical protein BU24DRAFT_429806 [Aaosphaeria arxii CBS 175.79]